MKRRMTGPMPGWLKSLILLGGVFLALPGLPLALAASCSVMSSLSSWYQGAVQNALGLITLTLLTLGAGLVVAWHASRSLAAKPSGPLRLPAAWLMSGLFLLALLLGIVVGTDRGMAIPTFVPALLVAAAVPPSSRSPGAGALRRMV